jgi:hypothetical protein
MGKYVQVITAAVVLLICGGAASAAAQSVVSSSVPYISGGVGLAARDELLAKEAEYNLKVVTAARSGAYLSGVRVIIEAAGGKQVLNTEMEGPLLLVQLPPGSYTIKAMLGGEMLTRTVLIPAQGRRQAMFQWDVPS